MVSQPHPRRLIHLPSRARLLSGLLLTAGSLHFVAPKFFDDIVPAEITDATGVSARSLTYASGVAEAAIGAGLLAPRTRRLSAAAAAALFIAVYPANINMVRLWWHKPALYRAIAIGRLPLQYPLIAAAVRIWREGGSDSATRR
ncbi:MAG: DoxX-like family protein [Gordonia sp. (in: high G+C Gram-positive bacteria)]